MAQLRDSTIDGNLEVTGNIILKNNNNGIQSVHPETGEINSLIYMSTYGNTVVGYDGYENKNGNTHIYGNDLYNYVASADANYRPYYKAGDAISFEFKGSGYVTNSGKNVNFMIPITKPVIGTPTATATSNKGFILLQNGYTHGSNGASNPVVYAKPTSYAVSKNYNSGFIVTAYFDVTTNVANNNPIGVCWDGTITLS